MRIFLAILLSLLNGCAYYSHTTLTAKADDVTSLAGAPVKFDNGDVLFDREMSIELWHKKHKIGE